MNLTRRRFIAISAGATLGFRGSSAHASPSVWEGVALGAQAKLSLVSVSREEGARLIALARAEIERLENIFSIYRESSSISRLNQSGELTTSPAEMLELLSLVKGIHNLTGGRFDPTIQPLWALYAENAGQPSPDSIEQVHKSVGMSKVMISPAGIRFGKPGMAMTLNGIAQGYITDRVVSLLKANGLENAVVNLGEISAMGSDPAGDSWKVGLAETGDQEPAEFVQLADSSIATSATQGTTFDGEVSHIIDPLSGRAVRSTWRRVSVIHKSAAVADGLSTAMIMMGEEDLRGVKLSGNTRVIALNENGRTFRL